MLMPRKFGCRMMTSRKFLYIAFNRNALWEGVHSSSGSYHKLKRNQLRIFQAVLYTCVRTKNVLSDSPGLVIFHRGEWILSRLYFPGGQVRFLGKVFEKIQVTGAEEKSCFGKLVRMIFGLVHHDYSLAPKYCFLRTMLTHLNEFWEARWPHG